MLHSKSLDMMRRVLAGEFDDAQYAILDPGHLETPEEHGRWHLCA